MKKRKTYQKLTFTTLFIVFALLISLNFNRSYLKPEILLKDTLLKINKFLINTTYSKTSDQS